MDLNIDLTFVTLFGTMLVTARSQFRAVRILSNSSLPLSAGRFRLDERRVPSRELPMQAYVRDTRSTCRPLPGSDGGVSLLAASRTASIRE